MAPGVVSYAPFPADNLAPTGGQYIDVSADDKISLAWHGSDADNGVASYEVYFGTGPWSAVYQRTIIDVTLNGGPVVAKTKYYWKVVTFDCAGNSSTLDTQQFSINITCFIKSA